MDKIRFEVASYDSKITEIEETLKEVCAVSKKLLNELRELKRELHAINEDSETILEREFLSTYDHGRRIDRKIVYDDYMAYCERNNFVPVTKNRLFKIARNEKIREERDNRGNRFFVFF